MRCYQEKYFGNESNGFVKDVDTATGVITGYFASFDTLDSDGDVFQKGAFRKTILENKGRVMHLLQHDHRLPLSRPELSEDKKGLFFKSEISKTTYGIDAIKLYQDGVYNEHSVGFESINSISDSQGKYDQYTSRYSTEKRPANIITEVKLWEGSTVTWGANPNTPMTGLKDDEMIRRAKERSELLDRTLHSGNFTDDTYVLLEIELKRLQSFLAAKPDESILPEEKSDYSMLLNSLKLLTINTQTK